MKQHEVTQLMHDIERSIQVRTRLQQRLARQEEVDLLQEWKEIEQIDAEITNKIRKRPIE